MFSHLYLLVKKIYPSDITNKFNKINLNFKISIIAIKSILKELFHK